jgi:hypothetical protein
MGDEEIIEIGVALAKNTTLKELDIGNQKLTTLGLSYLLHHFKFNTTLTSLTFSSIFLYLISSASCGEGSNS